ncbi:MAG: hypothetical protein SGI88_09445 [Candidatus Hydrogenedentes bacterium]|nr:hypothetical protein [Candidatus Hydrogenedentota bacterium]
MSAANEMFERLESVLEDWAADVSSTHQQLAGRVDSVRARLEETPERSFELEQVSAALQSSKAHFATLQETLRQCADASRQAVDRTEALEKALEILDEDVRGLKNAALHASGEQGSFEGLEPVSLTDAVNELRAAVDDQATQLARLEQQLATSVNSAGPSQQQWSRLERDLARLRGEMHRLRGISAGTASAQPAAFSGTFDEVATAEESVDLDITGFDNAGRRRRMGEILVEAGVLTPQQLERALTIQQEQPQRRLGSILIELGYTEANAVAQVLASQARVPFVRLDRDEPDPTAVRLVSERLAAHHICIPLRLDDERIVLAMANPMDLIAIEDIEHATGRGVDATAASAEGIQQAIKAYYSGEGRG